MCSIKVMKDLLVEVKAEKIQKEENHEVQLNVKTRESQGAQAGSRTDSHLNSVYIWAVSALIHV